VVRGRARCEDKFEQAAPEATGRALDHLLRRRLQSSTTSASAKVRPTLGTIAGFGKSVALEGFAFAGRSSSGVAIA
jgi:hypothetical protein